MFIERVHSPGLAHISYFVGGHDKAAVIDPRRDVEVYVELARQHGLRITHIFETHRNEDYVIGSRELAEITPAKIYHGDQLPFEYGVAVSEGDGFDLDGLRLGVLETPGHTHESICVTLADLSSSEEPVGVFTGDVLFVGDVGRTDFIEGGAELLARIAEIPGLEALATLVAALQAARAQIQVQSPAPILRIRIPEAERFEQHSG